MIRQRGSLIVKKVLLFLMLLVISFFVLFPLYWIITMSIKEKADILKVIPDYIPRRITAANYEEIFKNGIFLTYLRNSLIVAIGTTLLCCCVSAMAGFGLTRYNFRSKSAISVGVFIVRMIPSLIYIVPMYMIYSKLGMLDTRYGLILAYCTFSLPLSIWLFINFFNEIPYEIYESAIIDGASEYALFTKIALPLVLPSISVVTILTFIGAWNEFGLALVLTFHDNVKTLPIGINSLIQEQRDTPFGSIAAAGVLVMTPAIVLSISSQKYIVKGLTAGAVKG